MQNFELCSAILTLLLTRLIYALPSKSEQLKSGGCAGPIAPKFGIYQLDEDEASVQFLCQPKYSLVGSSRAFCQADGSWSAQHPICVGTDCAPPSLRSGTVQSNHGGGLIRLQCRTGFELNGPDVLACFDGQWNASIPKCMRRDSGKTDPTSSNKESKVVGKKSHEEWLEESDYSCVTGDRTVYPPSVPNARSFTQWATQSGRPRLYTTYQCRWGYATPGGPKTLYCQNEQWVGTVPKCQAVVREDDWLIQRDSSQGDSVPLTHDQLLHYADYSCISKEIDETIDAPSIDNGQATLRFAILDGLPRLYANYVCDDGFEPADKVHMYCRSRAWIGLLPKCLPAAEKESCQSNNGGCQHNCKDEKNSVTCSCKDGFILEGDNKSCEDIDECEVNSGLCGHKCDNTMGSYTCSCYPGFELGPDGRTCTRETDYYDS